MREVNDGDDDDDLAGEKGTSKFYFQNNGAFWKTVWKGKDDDATAAVNTTGATGGWGAIAMVRVVVDVVTVERLASPGGSAFSTGPLSTEA